MAFQSLAGIGLRSPHVEEMLATRPAVGWLEIHAENYMGGGPAMRALERLRSEYPVSVHGVGLSLGSADGLAADHLERLARNRNRYPGHRRRRRSAGARGRG